MNGAGSTNGAGSVNGAGSTNGAGSVNGAGCVAGGGDLDGDGDGVGGPVRWRELGEFSGDQVAMSLVMSRAYAQGQVFLAKDLMERLPVVFAALREGRIDRVRAEVFSDALAQLDDVTARQIAEREVGQAASRIPGQLRRRLYRQVIKANPGLARQRYDKTVTDRCVFLQPYTDGTAQLSAINLPPAAAAAAFNRVDRIARAAKSFGDVRTLPQLRADATLDLLSGRPFMLSASLDTLTAEADQAARNLGYGVDDPHDLAGTMPPPKPRHRPGTRTSTKTNATKTTQPKTTQPNATQSNATKTGAAKSTGSAGAAQAGAATSTGGAGATETGAAEAETGAGPGAGPGVGDSGEHADRGGGGDAGLSYPDVGWDPDRGRDDDPDERASQADLDLLATLFPNHDQRHDDRSHTQHEHTQHEHTQHDHTQHDHSQHDHDPGTADPAGRVPDRQLPDADVTGGVLADRDGWLDADDGEPIGAAALGSGTPAQPPPPPPPPPPAPPPPPPAPPRPRLRSLVAGDDPRLCVCGGIQPGDRRGVVNIEIRLSTLANLDDHPAIIAGYGPVLADVARQVAREQVTTRSGGTASSTTTATCATTASPNADPPQANPRSSEPATKPASPPAACNPPPSATSTTGQNGPTADPHTDTTSKPNAPTTTAYATNTATASTAAATASPSGRHPTEPTTPPCPTATTPCSPSPPTTNHPSTYITTTTRYTKKPSMTPPPDNTASGSPLDRRTIRPWRPRTGSARGRAWTTHGPLRSSAGLMRPTAWTTCGCDPLCVRAAATRLGGG